MSQKSQKIATIIHPLQGREFDAHYLGYFECFNQQLFFEAHEVLEALWLGRRGQPDGLFYKALIQLAGAFVHIQKKRRQPAMALFKLAQTNLSKYPTVYQALEVGELQKLIFDWLARMETADPFCGTLGEASWPRLRTPDSVEIK